MEKVSRRREFFSAKNVAFLAVLVALVIILQVFGGYFKIGATSLSFVLVPIILGGMLLGVGAGALLGCVFGLVVIIDALCGIDPFTMFLLSEQPVLTVLLCIVKGVAAGALSALLFKAIAKKNKYVAVFVSAAAAPIINTGIFILGALLITEPINAFLTSVGMELAGLSPFYIVVVICVGVNFFVELAINLVFAPAVYTVERVVEKQITTRKNNDNLS